MNEQTPMRNMPDAPLRQPRSAARRQVTARIGARIDPPEEPSAFAWEDTSAALPILPEKSFLRRQSPLFWLVATLLFIALLTVACLFGVRAWQQAQAARKEAQRLRELAEEKAKYKLEYRDLIDDYASEQGIPPALVAAVIYNESRFQPDVESSANARGLMQIRKDTGEWIAYRLDELNSYTQDSLYDPETNIRFGTWFLGYLSRMYGPDIVKIAAGYHAGQYSVKAWLENPEYSHDGQTLDKIPYANTEQYVKRVVSAYDIYTRHYYSPEPSPETAPE